MTPEQALAAALDIVGGPAALAREISTARKKITSQAISFWKVCPPKWLDEVFEATRKAKRRQAPTREQLCPIASRETPDRAQPAPGGDRPKTGKTPQRR